MKKSIIPSAFVICLAATSANAQQPTSGDGAWYYELGGAESVSGALDPNVVSVPIGITGELRVPNSCTSLDPVLSISNVLDDVRMGADQIQQTMVLAANNAIAALPSIVLQRALPGIYEHFQSAVATAEARVNVAVASCQELVERGSVGDNPFGDWVKIAREQKTGREIMSTGNDPVSAIENIDTTNGDEGVEMPGGRRGGAGQEPIREIADTVHVGYQATSQPGTSPNLGTTSTPPPPGTRLETLWPDINAAQEWSQQVLGERIVRTCSNCSSETVPGTGLLPKLEEEVNIVLPLIQAMVTSTSAPKPLERREASAANVEVTSQLIEAIKNIEDPQEQNLVANRIANDVAMARTVERALSVRRLLLTGQQVPELSANEALEQDLPMFIATLDEEIDNLLREHNIRKQLISNTAMEVLRREELRRSASQGSSVPAAIDPSPLEAGRVRNN